MLSMKKFSEEFINAFKEEFNNLPDGRFAIVEAKIQEVEKTNDTCFTGICSIVIDKEKNMNVPIVPTLYLDSYYDRYLNGESFDSLVQDGVDTFDKAQHEAPDILANYDKVSDPDFILENLTLKLVNAEANRNLLKNSPRVDFLDMTYSFRVVCSISNEKIGSYLLNDSVVEANGWNKENLFEIAKANMIKNNPPVIMSLYDKLLETFPADMIPPQNPNEPELYFLSGKDGLNGATYMMCEDLIHDFCEKHNSNIYILPSSIHEVLILEENKVDVDFLESTVKEVNSSVVDTPDLLSNSVYHYDKNTREFSIAVKGPELNISQKVEREHNLSL